MESKVKEVYMINTGDCFIKNDIVYIKIDEVFPADKDEVCAINLNNGKLEFIYMLDLVEPVNVVFKKESSNISIKVNVIDLVSIKEAQKVFINDISSEEFAKAISYCNTDSGFVAGAMWGLARAGMLIATKCQRGIAIIEQEKESD